MQTYQIIIDPAQPEYLTIQYENGGSVQIKQDVEGIIVDAFSAMDEMGSIATFGVTYEELKGDSDTD